MEINVDTTAADAKLAEAGEALGDLQATIREYMAVLIAQDGEWVTDFRRESIAAVLDCVDGMGSRWIFYPLVVVVTVNADGNVDDESTVAAYPDGLVGPDSLGDFLADVRAGDLQPLFELYRS